ncbi:Bcr/CflA family multidrug efflux MFS transporter [Herbaspirillum huttiense]|uniref:Bcr/CflA family multidrug efflux MFS transporter n=1 Tax=Herbaspirillum huttiense TaxID=863372 RepID=UPI001066D555|nr:Bcr/CflA family multidrug efflux MFS transporter [Herbaspirillum huttiense]MEE1636798.1 Bcr/CflA family multidrug efflux MFS transporter [Herbaspirillum huttiense NC40101]QBP78000.1 Bcr/CflA family multidrug efflux MFS transporter [Herbaspirillum huttiense]
MHNKDTSLSMGKFPPWLAVLAALTALGALAIDMYLPSFTAIAKELGVGTNLVQLTLASFLVGLAVGQMFYGPLSDRFGRKPPLFFGIALYFVCSLLCIFVQSIETLIVLRLFQGLGGSAGMVIPRAMVRDRMGAEGSAKAFSMLMLVFGLAPILAPFIGGLMLVFASWRGIFVVLTIFGLLCMLGTRKYLTETVDVSRAEPLHLGRTLRQYWGLLRHRQFMSFVLCGGLVQAGMFAYIAGGPFVVIELHGIKPQYFGFVFASNAIGLIAASQVNARLVVKRSAERVLGKVLWVPAGLSLAVVLAVLAGLESLPLLLFGFFGFLTAYGFTGPNATAIALKHQGRQAGTAAALMGTLQFGMGVLSGVVMSLWHDGTALPLVSVMAICGVSAFLLYHFVAKHEPVTPALH